MICGVLRTQGRELQHQANVMAVAFGGNESAFKKLFSVLDNLGVELTEEEKAAQEQRAVEEFVNAVVQVIPMKAT